MPPPTPSQIHPPEISNVRMATLSSSPAATLTCPIAPVYASRAVGSSSAAISIARTLGAPVTDPGGKVARSRAALVTSGPRWPTTSETRCQTACRSARTSAGTRTLPGVQTRPRSLRMRSTIITFSARFFADAVSSSGSESSGAVPLIGDVSTSSPVRRRNSSGEKLATAPSGASTNAA